MQNTIPTIYETPEEYRQKIEMLKAALADADAILIGAGAGLSTAAGFTYSGERFEKYFSDFRAKHGFTDMYTDSFFLSPLCIQSTEFRASTFFSRSLRDCLLPRTYP